MYEIDSDEKKQRFEALGPKRSDNLKALILALQDWAEIDKQQYIEGDSDLYGLACSKWEVAVDTIIFCHAGDVLALRFELCNKNTAQIMGIGPFDVDALINAAFDRAQHEAD